MRWNVDCSPPEGVVGFEYLGQEAVCRLRGDAPAIPAAHQRDQERGAHHDQHQPPCVTHTVNLVKLPALNKG